MSWGVSNVNHKSEMPRGKLSWANIGSLIEGKDLFYIAKRSKNYWLHEMCKPHPVTGQYAPARCYRMYQTDILQFFADGAMRILTHPSAITYNEISDWGPVRCFNDNQSKYEEKRRFGGWGKNFPIPDGTLNIDKDGFVVDPVIDKQTILDPTKRAELTRIAKDFRAQMLNRMLLGEFGDIWSTYGTYKTGAWGKKTRTGWWAQVPLDNDARAMAQTMLTDNFEKPFMFRGNPAKSKEHAVRVACDQICHEAYLKSDEWNATIETNYGRVNVYQI